MEFTFQNKIFSSHSRCMDASAISLLASLPMMNWSTVGMSHLLPTQHGTLIRSPLPTSRRFMKMLLVEIQLGSFLAHMATLCAVLEPLPAQIAAQLWMQPHWPADGGQVWQLQRVPCRHLQQEQYGFTHKWKSSPAGFVRVKDSYDTLTFVLGGILIPCFPRTR